MTNGSERSNSRGGKCWRRLAIRALAALAIGALVIVIYQRGTDSSRDAIYNGRSIESIASDLAYPPSTPRYDDARAAILKLNDRALPGLRSIIHRGIPRPVRWFELYQGRMPVKLRNWIVRRFRPFEYRSLERGAFHAVGILGTNAAPLASALGERFASGDLQTRSDLVQVLPKVGAAIIPQIEPFLTSPDLRTRGLATFCFYQLGPIGAGSAPALVEGLKGADANQRRLVAQTLSRMGPRAFPATTNLLIDPNPETRKVGLDALAGMLPRMMMMTPLILDRLHDPNRDVRLQAALLIADWWPMPISKLKQKFDALPKEDPSKTMYAASFDALERDQPLLLSVLREGLHTEPSLQLQVAKRLVAIGAIDGELLASMRLLASNTRLPTNQWNEANLLLKQVSQQFTKEVLPESDPNPRRVEGGKSPPSIDQPLPGRSP